MDRRPTEGCAQPPRRCRLARTPQSTPPMPFTEWPYGGATAIGVTRPYSVDSPLIVALGNTQLGAALNTSHIQIYGWIEPGANISTNSVKPGGNLPAGYAYTPNTVQLDQAVVYIERLPDTCRTIISIGVSASLVSMVRIIATRRRTAYSAINFSTTTSSTAMTFRWSVLPGNAGF